MKKLVFILLLISRVWPALHAQEAYVDAKLDTTDILIGDQIKLHINFSIPLDYRVIWPFYKDTLAAGIEIISQTPVDTVISEKDKLVNMMQSLTITAFDSGSYYIPPVRILYQPIDDTSFREVSSIPMYLKVHTMDVDTAQAIKAIKAPIGAPLTFAEILPWLLVALAAAAVIFLAIYIIRRRKNKQPIFQLRPKPVLPPYIVAINGLEALKKKKLWQAGLTKDFYTELTDILRIYIEGRYGVQAVEMTTDEIMDGMKNTDAGSRSIEKLGKTLVLADLVKFAKEQPLPGDNDNSLSYGMDFVNETRPHDEPPAEKENTENKEVTEITEVKA